MKHYFSQLIVFGLLTVSSFSSFADEIEDEQKMPVPAIERVIFDEDGNPFTMPDMYNPDKEIDPDLCKGFTLTEADVREFFRVSRRSNRIEAHEFIVSRCRIRGDLLLKGGDKAGFEIDIARQGTMFIGRDVILWFYCAKCKHPAYGDVCDIKCLRDELEADDREKRRKAQKMPTPVIKQVIFDDNSNPITFSQAIGPEKECTGFTLTEADVKKFFSAPNRFKNYFDAHISTRCQVKGTLIFENGRKAGFEISPTRQGNMSIDGIYPLDYYCGNCKHPAYVKACDIKCLKAEFKAMDRRIREGPLKALTVPIPAVVQVIFDEGSNPIVMPEHYGPEKECDGFTLSEADVKEFFSIQNRLKTGDPPIYTRCQVRGSVVLKNGKKATFQIDRSREGAIAVDGGYFTLFYCAKCEHPAYYADKKATKQ